MVTARPMNAPRLALVAMAVALLVADSAVADEFSMRVNEIEPNEGIVELLDFGAAINPRFDNAYTVRSYDGAANDVGAIEYTAPLPFAGQERPFVLSMPLAAGSGQVCFERPRDPGTEYPQDYRIHCMGYGDVTTPAMRRIRINAPRPIPMPIGAFPPPGQSVQRQPCGRAAVGPATRGEENVLIDSACAGLPTACDDPRRWDHIEPRMVVTVPRVHDVDRPLVVKVKMNERGDVSMRGSFSAGRRGEPFGPVRRELRANVPVRIKLQISRRMKRLVRSVARRGFMGQGSVVSIGRDNACFPNRYHSSRSFKLVP